MKTSQQQQRQYGTLKSPLSSLSQSPSSTLIFHSDFNDNSNIYQPFKAIKQSDQFFNFFTKPPQQFTSFTDRSLSNNSLNNKNMSASNIMIKAPSSISQGLLPQTPSNNDIKWRPKISSTCRKSQQDKSLLAQDSSSYQKPLIQKTSYFRPNSNFNAVNSLNIQGNIISRTSIQQQKYEQSNDRKQQQSVQEDLNNRNYQNPKSLHQTTSNHNIIGYQRQQQQQLQQQQPINNVLFHSQNNTPRYQPQAVQFPTINSQERINKGQSDDSLQDFNSIASLIKAGNNRPVIIPKKLPRNEGISSCENLMIRGKSAQLKCQQKWNNIGEPSQIENRCQSALSQSQLQQQSGQQQQLIQNQQILTQHNNYRPINPNNSQIICRKTIHGLKKRDTSNNNICSNNNVKTNVSSDNDIPESITAFKRIPSPSKNLLKDNYEESTNIFNEFSQELHQPQISNSSPYLIIQQDQQPQQEQNPAKTRSFRELPNISAEKVEQLQQQSLQQQSNDNNTSFSQIAIEITEPVPQIMNYKEKIWSKIIQQRKSKVSQIQGAASNTHKDDQSTATSQFSHVKLPSFSAISSPLYCSVDPIDKYDNFELFFESTQNLNSSTNASSYNQLIETIPSINFETFNQKEDQQQKYEFTLGEYDFYPSKEHESKQLRKQQQLKIIPKEANEKRAALFEQEEQQYLVTPRLDLTISFGNTLE